MDPHLQEGKQRETMQYLIREESSKIAYKYLKAWYAKWQTMKIQISSERILSTLIMGEDKKTVVKSEKDGEV